MTDTVGDWCNIFLSNKTGVEAVQKLEDWYEGMNKNQRIFVYAISMGLVFVFGAGLLPLAILIYLELGLRGRRE